MARKKEEVKKFYADMRSKWKEAKELSSKMNKLQEDELKKIHEVLPNMSAMGYLFCKRQMEAQKVD